MRYFLNMLFYLLDTQDRKNFLVFFVVLFIGGLVSLLGIGAVIPLVKILIEPNLVKLIPILKNFTYIQAVTLSISFLIISFWIKNGVAFIVLKMQAKYLSNLAAKIQKKLFAFYIHSPYVYHVRRNSAELISNINLEISIVSTQVIGQLGNLLNEVITASIIFIALLVINPVFALMVISTIYLTVKLFMKSLRLKTNYYGKLRVQYFADLTQVVIHGLGGIKEIKIYNKEAFFINKVNELSNGIAEASAFSIVFGQLPRFLIESTTITVVLILVLCFLAFGYNGKQMILLMSIFGVAAIQLLPSMNRLMQALTSIKYGLPALEKIYKEFLQYNNIVTINSSIENDIKNKKVIQFNNKIKLKNINFAYGNDLILKDVNIGIIKNKKIALVGSSGAGKTTLIDILLGLLTVKSGEVWVDDTLINDHNIKNLQRYFGYIPQIIYIYNCNLRENIALGIPPEHIDDERVWECLKISSLDAFVKEKPDTLNTLVGENGIQLSGGQRQRIGIARALYCNPDILVMDEATAALDNQTESDVTQALSQAGLGRTIITIAHRLSTIRDYDCIYVMEKGEVVGKGTYEQLLASCSVFNQMINISKT